MTAPTTTPTTKTLVLGATGATGRFVVQFLLDQSPTSHVKVLCRDVPKMKSLLSKNDHEVDSTRLTILEGSILKLSMNELDEMTQDCSAVVSCLGHNPTYQGMWGTHDRFLVSDTVTRLMSVMQQSVPQSQTETTGSTSTRSKKKFVLMASEGCAIPGDDPRGLFDRFLLYIIRWLVPPHVDNELACAHLWSQHHSQSTSSSFPEWVIVRPCDLIDDSSATSSYSSPTKTNTYEKYVLHSKPTGSLFGSGTVSRASVAQFMTDLILNSHLWEQYKNQAPVIHGAPVETDKTK